jgi:hypothetical protein
MTTLSKILEAKEYFPKKTQFKRASVVLISDYDFTSIIYINLLYRVGGTC